VSCWGAGDPDDNEDDPKLRKRKTKAEADPLLRSSLFRNISDVYKFRTPKIKQ